MRRGRRERTGRGEEGKGGDRMKDEGGSSSFALGKKRKLLVYNGVYVTVRCPSVRLTVHLSVCLSVCLSVPFCCAAAACGGFAAAGPTGGRYRSTAVGGQR